MDLEINEVLKQAHREIEFLRIENNRKDLLINNYESVITSKGIYDLESLNKSKCNRDILDRINDYFTVEVSK